MWLKQLASCLAVLVLASACVTNTVNLDGSRQNTPVNLSKLANTYIELAIQYQQHGAPQVALERANLALKVEPDNPRAAMIRAMILQQLAQLSAAELDFKQSIRLDATYSEAHVNYAVFLCAEQRYPEAVAHFSAALSSPLYYTPEVAYFSRGNCALNQGDLAAANQDFLMAMSYRNVPPATFIAMARLQYLQKNYTVANHYINKFSLAQTPASYWLHIQILQGLIDQSTSSSAALSAANFRDKLGSLLLKNYGETPEAQQYLLKYPLVALKA